MGGQLMPYSNLSTADATDSVIDDVVFMSAEIVESPIDSVENDLAEAVAAAIAKRRAGRPTKDEQLKIEALSLRRKRYLRTCTRALS